MSYIKDPKSIEVRSFEIITEGLAGKADHFSEEEQLIVKRLIHTTGDFDQKWLYTRDVKSELNRKV